MQKKKNDRSDNKHFDNSHHSHSNNVELSPLFNLFCFGDLLGWFSSEEDSRGGKVCSSRQPLL
eukprot:6379795-Amphidinium_carterae.1